VSLSIVASAERLLVRIDEVNEFALRFFEGLQHKLRGVFFGLITLCSQRFQACSWDL
jgi:hypothetical protein